jgi:hypothetical protein
MSLAFEASSFGTHHFAIVMADTTLVFSAREFVLALIKR